MGERKFWMMYLHPSDWKGWFSNFKFNSELEAYRYFLCRKGVVGMDVGWDIYVVNGKCKFDIWGKNRAHIFRQFYFDVKKGDIILFNKKCGNIYVQAILEVLEDKIYIHDKPLPDCKSYEDGNDCLNEPNRIEITKCMWAKWGISNRGSLNFEKYHYDPKLWFSMLRKIKLLRYWESQIPKFEEIRRPKNTPTLFRLGEANKHIIDKIKKIVSDVLTMEKAEELITIMHSTGLNQIILYGPPGSGKTYFAQKVAKKLIEEPNHEWILSNVDNFWDNFCKYIDGKTLKTPKECKEFNVLVEDEKINIQPLEGETETNIDKDRMKEILRGKIHRKSYEEVILNEFIDWVKRENFKKEGIYKLIQFHPSYTYEDFIRGIEVKTENGQPVYQTKNKIFAEMCEIATLNSDTNFVLIIDEINRANLPAVLGELIYALEYRNEEVEIPYEINKSKTLVVPKNLYIIGTMNTADRSAGRIDYAIRRRFIFYPVHADPDKASDEGRKLMELVNKFIEKNISPDYDPEDVKAGHTYFMVDGDKEEKVKTIAHKFLYQVVPLIYDYIVDGLITPEKESGKGYEFKLEDKKFYLRGGRLYNEDGTPVDIKEIIKMISQ